MGDNITSDHPPIVGFRGFILRYLPSKFELNSKSE